MARDGTRGPGSGPRRSGRAPHTCRTQRMPDGARLRGAFALAFLVVTAAIGGLLSERYISRLSNHAGYFLVPVDDAVGAPLTAKPRRSVVILVDGLRRDSAETMASTRALAKEGQCRISDQ